MNTNKILNVAVMLVLGSAAVSQVNATDFSSSSPIKLATELKLSGTDQVGLAGNDTFTVPLTTGVIVSTTAQYYVQITLTGGAKFGGGAATGLALKCYYGGTTAISATADAPLVTTGGTVASFRLADGTLATTGCFLHFSGDGDYFTLTSGAKNYTMSILTNYTHPSTAIAFSKTQEATLVSFSQGLVVSQSAGSVTVDVVNPALSKVFLDKANGDSVTNLGTTTAAANLGRIMYTPASDVKTLTGGAVDYDSFLASATLLVSGLPIAAAVSAMSGSSTAVGGVYLSSTATCEDALAVDGTGATAAITDNLAKASGTQVSFTVDATNFGAGTDSGIHICMLPNGISTIDRGTVSFTLTSKTDQSLGTPNLSVTDSVLTTVTKNGASIKVLNIPSPENATDQAFIRLYNMGSSTGKVMGTLYSQEIVDATKAQPQVLGTANVVLVDALAPNAVVVLNAAQIASKIGVTSWPGRAWLQMEGEVQGLRVQALIRSNGSGGVLVNMSDRVKADNEQLCRSEEELCRTPK